MSYTEAWLSGPKDTRFYTRTYRPVDGAEPKAAVVFVHGFAEHIARYEHVFPAWAQRGLAVFAYDQRGFGRTALDERGRSVDSVYAKTSWDDQLADLGWALAHLQRTFPGVPSFLYGHSMGGAIVIGFVTRKAPPPDRDTVDTLTGVIATSPLLLQSNPVPGLVRLIGTRISRVFPWMTLRAAVNPSDISHDPAVNDAYCRDPYVKPFGTLRGLSDMLNRGEGLLLRDYVSWPPKLPMLLIHGSEDKVTSHGATEQFFKYCQHVQDKSFSTYQNGYHELHNEPDGVKERLIEECISWVEAHATASSPPAKL